MLSCSSEAQPQSTTMVSGFRGQLKLYRGGVVSAGAVSSTVTATPRVGGLSVRFPRARARYKNYFWPALVRQYGEIEGPYVLQMDACKCLANGVDRFNEYMGREAIRVIFRGRDEEDPKARCAGRPWRGGRGHLGNLGRGHRKTAKGRPHPRPARAANPRSYGPSGEPGRRPFAVFPGGPKTRLLRFSFRTCIGNTLGIL